MAKELGHARSEVAADLRAAVIRLATSHSAARRSAATSDWWARRGPPYLIQSATCATRQALPRLSATVGVETAIPMATVTLENLVKTYAEKKGAGN